MLVYSTEVYSSKDVRYNTVKDKLCIISSGININNRKYNDLSIKIPINQDANERNVTRTA